MKSNSLKLPNHSVIGVIGGVGPQATQYLYSEIIKQTQELLWQSCQ